MAWLETNLESLMTDFGISSTEFSGFVTGITLYL
jgi:hypothetical protein